MKEPNREFPFNRWSFDGQHFIREHDYYCDCTDFDELDASEVKEAILGCISCLDQMISDLFILIEHERKLKGGDAHD